MAGAAHGPLISCGLPLFGQRPLARCPPQSWAAHHLRVSMDASACCWRHYRRRRSWALAQERDSRIFIELGIPRPAAIVAGPGGMWLDNEPSSRLAANAGGPAARAVSADQSCNPLLAVGRLFHAARRILGFGSWSGLCTYPVSSQAAAGALRLIGAGLEEARRPIALVRGRSLGSLASGARWR